MNAFLDGAVVGLLVLASLGYAAVKLGPQAWRKRVFLALSGIFNSAPASFKLQSAARRLEAAAGKNQGACGGCDNCGTEPSSVPQPSAEISIPVAKIRRRV